MTSIILTTKKGVIHRFSIHSHEDGLSTLDKYLKKNKLAFVSLKEVRVLSDAETMHARTIKASFSALSYKIKKGS